MDGDYEDRVLQARIDAVLTAALEQVRAAEAEREQDSHGAADG